MNHIYLKNLLSGSVIAFLLIQGDTISAQRTSTAKHGDRYDLVANINKVGIDRRKIENLKILVDNSKKEKNKKALKIHREKLAMEKKILKTDYAHAREQELNYKENKGERIDKLESELKASNNNYESIRTKTKKDLSKKNYFALRKDADDLLSAVQERNEISSQLSMEKSDLLETVNAMDAAWKKVKQNEKQLPEKIDKVSTNSNLTNK